MSSCVVRVVEGVAGVAGVVGVMVGGEVLLLFALGGDCDDNGLFDVEYEGGG